MNSNDNKSLAIKVGSLAVGLAVVAYIGLHLGRGDLPVIGESAARVLTPEEQVAAEVKANPALVSRQACVNLYIAAPGYLGMLARPTYAALKAMPTNELRAWVVTASGDGYVGGVYQPNVTHDNLAQDLFADETTKPRFANVDPAVETRRINAYLDTCRSLYPGRDEIAASIVRDHGFAARAWFERTVGRFAR